MSTAPGYIRTPTGYLMVLRQGADVFARLEHLATAEAIPSASFTGLGFVHATFGFWDSQKNKPRFSREALID